MKKFLLILIFFFSFLSLFFSCDNTTDPYDNLKPGRRDYVWTVDTLWTTEWFGITEVWGSSPNSIWITASGVTVKDALWFYNGVKWTRYSQLLSSGLNTVFGVSPDEIWIGDDGTIWRNTGSGWQKYKQISLNGYKRVVISSIYGISKNNLYAVGFADNPDGSGKGIILKYDGNDWDFLDIPDIRVGFEDIKRFKNGGYIINGTINDNGFLSKLYIFDGIGTLKEIYSDYSYPSLDEMNNEVYITINNKIYKCKNDKLELWKEFPGIKYYDSVLGRSEKDFFGIGDDGILHYNGTDLVNLYKSQLDISVAVIFEKDVFFCGQNPQTGIYIIIRGTLKE